MEGVVLSANVARQKWGETVKTVLSGKLVIIERYGRPTLVMLSHEEWQKLKRRIATLQAAIETGDTFANIETEPP